MGKGVELATEGKVKAGEGLRSLSKMVNENAYQIDEKLGAKYGDYARNASKSLDGYASRLDEKSVDELVEDGREFVRRSPGKAIGIAAVVGFMVSTRKNGMKNNDREGKKEKRSKRKKEPQKKKKATQIK